MTRLGAALVAWSACAIAACGAESSGSTTGTAAVPSPCSTCSAGTHCDSITGTCVADATSMASAPPLACAPPISTSEASADTVQHLGTFTVGQTVTFVVPADAVSLTIVEQAVSAPATISYRGKAIDDTAVPLRLRSPSGATVYGDLSTPSDDGSGALAFFGGASPGVGALTIPNTSAGLSALARAGGLETGTWGVTISDYAYECTSTTNCTGGSSTSVYDVTVLVKRATSGAIPPTGTIDIAFYFATREAPGDAGQATTPLTASGATSDPDVSRMVSSLRRYLGNANLSLGTVTFRDLPSDVQAAYATGVDVDATGACAGLGALLRHAEAGRTLNVFVVSSFTSSEDTGYAIAGVDPTIPGPATFPGTRASGFAVSSADLRAGRAHCGGDPTPTCGADATALVVAHEAGHFLGLYHTTESDGSGFDPLSDTARCPCTACRSATATETCGAHLMTARECSGASSSCGGAENLMFWVMTTSSTGAITPEQAKVMRANPLIR